MKKELVKGVLICLSAQLILSACGQKKEKDPMSTDPADQPAEIAAESDSSKMSKGADKDGCQIHFDKEAQAEAGVKDEAAVERVLEFKVKTTGEVLANANFLTHVNTPVTGRVTQVLVSVGDYVNEGKPLLYINSNDIEQIEADLLQNAAQVSADLKRDLLQIDSDINQAQAQIALSESTYKRKISLVDEKIASKAEFEAAKTEFEKDKITIDSLKRKRIASINLSAERGRLLAEPVKQKLRLLGVPAASVERVIKTGTVDPVVPVTAPETGVVSERMINVGELADPSKPLFTIADFHSVWLKADIFEKDIAKIEMGQPIELELDSFPGTIFKGKLNYVADSVNPETRTLLVRAEVANPGLKLKPKMFARMNILVGEHKVLAVPKTAIQDAGNDKVVYVQVNPSHFQEHKVIIGGEAEGYVEILSGLKAGDRVVTQGSLELRSESLKESE